MPHQSEGVRILRDNPRWLLHWRMGTGKTLTVLKHCEDVPMPTVVIAPATTLRTAWTNDAAHCPGVELRVARGTSDYRAQQICRPNENTVVVTTHESFRRDVNRYMAWKYRRFVIDEASKIRGQIGRPNVSVEACMKFADSCERVVLMSGKLAPNGTYECFWPYRVMDKSVFGTMPWAFYGRYFVPKVTTVNKWDVVKEQTPTGETIDRKKLTKKDYTTGFTLREDHKAEYIEKLKSRCTVIREKDVLNLPEPVDIMRELEADDELRDAYLTARTDLEVVSRDGTKSKFHQNAKLIKMRQICGGFCKVDGVAKEIHRRKVDWLLDEFIGAEIEDTVPLVIAYEFTGLGQAVVDALSAKYGAERVAWIRGGTADATPGILKDFQDGKVRYIVAHPAAFAHGADGAQKVCNTMVFLEWSFSADYHDQIRCRIHRKGMGTDACRYVYLCFTLGDEELPPTADETALWAVRRKGRADRLILDAIQGVESDGLSKE